MDVTLSILAGLGLRLFLIFYTDTSPSNRLTIALLGLWEGIVLHQLSGRSSSPSLDHFLAYVLRLALDVLLSKNIQRMIMVIIWTILGTITSEAVSPNTVLRESRRADHKERKPRTSRSIPLNVPILSIPLPPRVRAYKPPESEPQQFSLSTLPTIIPQPEPSPLPIFSADRPATPPSFFLQETAILSLSPSPQFATPVPVTEQDESTPESQRDNLPVRPRSGLASFLDRSPVLGSLLPAPIPLPTPPDSAESALPSDGILDAQNIAEHEGHRRIPHGLSPITEEKSTPPDDTTPPSNGGVQQTDSGQTQVDEYVVQDATAQLVASATTSNIPLPVPSPAMRPLPTNPISEKRATLSNFSSESLFKNPFPISGAPLPVRVRHQESTWQSFGATSSLLANLDPPIERNPSAFDLEEIPTPEGSNDDELCTPGAQRKLTLAIDDEHEVDPLVTPILSPLVIGLENEEFDILETHDPSSSSAPALQGAQPTTTDVIELLEDMDDSQLAGSLSQNPLLHPPLPTSSPLFRPSSSFPLQLPYDELPPPSPSTIHSDPSETSSVLSPAVPSKRFLRGDEFRRKAREEEATRAEIERQMKLAEAQGNIKEVLTLKVRLREMDALANKLHEKAARRYFAARNPHLHTKRNEIDLHGLRPRETYDRLDRAIVEAYEKKLSTLRVIVGKGLHSENQKPILKPTIQREMQRLNIPCDVDQRNPGVLILTLPPAPP